MKQGRPVVVARQPEDEALQELLKRAAERGSEVIQAPDKVNVASKVGLFCSDLTCSEDHQ